MNLRSISAISAIALSACTFAPPPTPAFYSTAHQAIPSKPGEVIRHEPIAGAPVGAQAYRVLYSSTGLDGKPIAVSGVVVIPYGAPPSHGWDVVAWAHPTTGIAQYCAPSLKKDPLGNIEGLEALLARGYVVTATDYPGLGTVGPHPYLVGISEGRAVLDLIRAARNLPGEKIGPRFAVWGHSQGGQAALFAGELNSSYSPELALVGVGAAAPATDLAVLLQDDIHSLAGRVLISYSVWSWSRIYDTPIDSIVRPKSMKAIDEIAAGCIQTYGETYSVGVDALPLGRNFLYADPDSVQPYAGLIAANRAGNTPTAAPLYIVQGTADLIVRPMVTKRFAARLCANGETVRLDLLADVGHMGSGKAAAPDMVNWMVSLFAGNPPPNDCESILKQWGPSPGP
jgi:alpha-beta hydrolase superfamily lysophospholipase